MFDFSIKTISLHVMFYNNYAIVSKFICIVETSIILFINMSHIENIEIIKSHLSNHTITTFRILHYQTNTIIRILGHATHKTHPQPDQH